MKAWGFSYRGGEVENRYRISLALWSRDWAWGMAPGPTPWDRPVLKNYRGLEMPHLEAAWV
ncbi:MAG: hypothetical protein ACUVQD_06805 [Thermaceae bacterium]